MTDKTKKITALIAIGLIGVLGGAAVAMGIEGDDDDDDTTETVVMGQPEQAVQGQTAAAPDSSSFDDDVAQAQPVDADDQPISAAEGKRVAAAAVDAAGGGTVTDLDRSDDPGEAWEVEVVREGVEIDIALDEQLNRVENSTYDD